MSDSQQSDQYTFDDPTTRYPKISPPEQRQEEPGLQSEMTPVPDIGEKTYRGTGRLAGRKALVTGADSGIGAAVALAYAREGADVTLSYLPQEESDADHVVSLIEAEGRKAVRVPGDLTDPEHCRTLVQTAVDEMGGLDIVVNVAGKQVSQTDLLDITDEQFDLTFKTNVYAAFWIIKAALPHLSAGATIINTASLEAWQPAPIRVDYASTKGAINNLSKAIALQVAPKGIRVNVVAPGPTWSALQVSSGVPTEDLPEFGAETALGRAGQPAEIAPVYVFLASPESSFVVGATYAVTGGMPTP